MQLSGDEILSRATLGREKTGIDSKSSFSLARDKEYLSLPRTARGGEAVRALRSAVSAGRRLDLGTHPNPACVAYFKRGEMLLERVDMVLDVLRRGLRDQNVKALHAGLRDAERIGFDSVEVQAARGFLDAARRH